MPEGFMSVADMKVIVDANADKFHTGVKGILQALGELDQNGNKTLTGLDKMMLAVGDASIGVSGKVKLLAGGLEAGVAMYQRFAKEGRAAAEALGVTEEYDNLVGTLDKLGYSLLGGVSSAFSAVASAGSDAASSMLGFSSASAGSEQQSKATAATLLTDLTQAFKSISNQIDILNFKSAESGTEMDRRIAGLDLEVEKIEQTIVAYREQIALAEQASGVGAMLSGFFNNNLLSIAERQKDEYLAQRALMEEAKNSLPTKDWKDATQTHKDYLAQEIIALERRVAVLGMSKGAMEEHMAVQKAMDAAARDDVLLNEAQVAWIKERAAEVRRLTEVEEAYNKKKREAEQEAQRAAQRQRTEVQIFANADRELATLRARAKAVDLNVAASAELLMYERLLQQLRANGTEDEKKIERIREISAAFGAATQALADHQAELRALGEVGQSIAGELSSAFARWTQGAKLDVKDMVASILADLAQLTLRRSVLEPLFGGGSGGGAGLFGDLMASVFGGFRADGGDVETGRAYVVGERGPEWFMPREPGSILPNGTAPAGRAGGEVHVYVHGTPEFEARVVSTAEGVVAHRAPAIVGQAVEATQAVRDAYGMDGPWR